MKKILMTLFMASGILFAHAQDNTPTETPNDINLLDLVQDQPSASIKKSKKLNSATFWDGRRHSLDLTIGDPIVTMMLNHTDYQPTLGNDTPNYRWLYDLTLPTFNLHYHYAFTHWFELGATVGVTADGSYYTYLPDNTRTSMVGDIMLYIMPSLRFTYFRRDLINLYAGLAVGVELDIFDANNNHYYYDGSSRKKGLGVAPAGQLTVVGLQVGRRVYWNFEIGFGNRGIFNTGIGVKL